MAENVDIERENLQVAIEQVLSHENLETDVPDQSENDKKSYKSILLQNGLKALIVSDPDPVSTGDSVGYKTAALALTVDCGSFKDPQNYRGLTHVLEHLLHMDGIFTSHVKQCGGFSNVRADCEETMFYFEVPELHLTSTLLHLTALLIKQDVLERERLPIIADLRQEVEDYKAQRNLLLASLAADNYPHGLYDWDNLAELKEKDPEDALAAMIQQLRRDNYAANHMHVCLQASLSLKELEQMICRHFGVIPSNGMASVNLTRFDYRTAFRPEFHENVFYVTSSDGGCRLDLTWLLPSVRQYYRSKPEAFLAYLLSQEGPGSLCVYLRHRRWSVHLLAGVDDNGFDLNSIYSLFKLSIHLTDEGYKHIDGVLAATFAYIKLIAASDAAVLRPLYDKQQLIEEARFRFQTHRAALYNVQDLVLSSKYYPEPQLLEDSVKELPQGGHCILCNALNDRDANTVIMNYYQIGPNTIRVQSILDLMMQILEDPIYEYLCTQEKLCYEVYARVRLYYGIVGYSITASSHQTKKGAKNLERGIDQFHHAMLQILNKMRDDEFLRSKEKLIQAKLAPDENLAMESDRHWEEIINGDFLFDRNQQQADALHNITKEEMISFMVDTDAAHCRKLSIQVIGNPPTEWAYDWASERTNYSSDVFLETHQTPSSVSVSDDQFADGSENGDEKSTSFSWEESLYEDLGSRLNLVLLPRDGDDMHTIVDIDEFKTSLDTYPRKSIRFQNAPLTDFK
ncbi:GL12899 [Drosophila persimilis]|uniref:GL12899 n=1 Tax=Drosophila persimilis TaxID=7234 RepID=B4GV65_DROPE|nr:GL12899 [Drosophila persimilis]